MISNIKKSNLVFTFFILFLSIFFMDITLVSADTGKVYDITAAKTKGSDVTNGVNYLNPNYEYTTVVGKTEEYTGTYYTFYGNKYTVSIVNGTLRYSLVNPTKLSSPALGNYRTLIGKYVLGMWYSTSYMNNGYNTNLGYSIYRVSEASDSSKIVLEKLNFETTGSGSENGVFTLDSTKNDSFPIYFYRGNIDNNNLIFAGYCWQIIRTTDMGGTKIIYNGSPNEYGQCISTTDSNGIKLNSNKWIKEPYFSDTGYGTIRGSSNDSSEQKQAIEKWYDDNLIKYDSMIEDTPFCFDRTVYTDRNGETSYTSNTYTSSEYYTGSYVRRLKGQPTLNCPDSRDILTVENGTLKRKVGLITSDELLYSGYYTHTYLNSNSSLKNPNLWLSTKKRVNTMSISIYYVDDMMVFGTTGNAETSGNDGNIDRTYNEQYTYPVISLNNDTEVLSGDGTQENPYIIEELLNIGLSDLKINNTTINGFATGTTEYTYKTTNAVTITATPIDENATVTGTGTYSPGETATITVTEADGTVTIYTVTIQDYNHDNTLKSLSVTSNPEGTMEPSFNPTINSYTVKVNNDVTSATINAEANSSLSTLTGTGEKTNLSVGDNNFNLVVVAEDGESNIYSVNIRRMSNVATLQSLSITGASISPSFSSSTTSYTTTVPYATNSINVNATATSGSNATVTGTGSKNLSVGTNTIQVIVTSEDSSVTNTYTIVATREAPSTDSSLKSLTVNNGTLSPTFSSNETSYTVDVDNTVSSIDLSAVANDSNATLTGTGTKSLNVGNNVFSIVVTAQDGTTKTTYTVIVHRKSNDATLSSLSVDGFTLVPNFSSDTNSYKVIVEKTTTNININAEVNNEFATISGTGEKAITAGEEASFDIVVTSEMGNTKTYTINVSSKSKDNNLKSLSVEGKTISPAFDKDITSYTLSVNGNVDKINILAEKNDEKATLTGTGERNLDYGINNLDVEVTAENGDTKKYTIVVTRLKDNSKLKSLEVVGYDIGFSPSKKDYTLTVENDVSSIKINAEADDDNATVSGVGTKDVVIGSNTYEIEVEAEDGTTSTYTIVVKRKDDDSSLRSLNVEGFTIEPTFSKTITSYTLTVPSTTEKVNIIAEKNSSVASVIGDGQHNLVVGNNRKEITVTAENGNITTYVITIKRKSDDLTLKSLSVDACTISPKLDSTVTEYNCTVDYDVDSATIYAELNNSDATLTGTGSKNLDYGNNQFTLSATVDTFVKNYIINIRRGAKGFKQIKIDNKKADDYKVSDNVYEYTVKASSVEFSFEKYNSMQTIFSNDITTTQSEDDELIYLGVKDLDLGENIITVNVVQYGESEVYTFKITREKSTNSKLKLLSYRLGYFVEDFEPDTLEYTWKVNNQIDIVSKNSLRMETADKNATISVVDSVDISNSSQDFEIVVTAEDGIHTTTYTIHVVHDEKSDATLKSLSIDKGYFTPEFNKKNHVYEVYEYVDEASITVTAEPTMDEAIVTGAGLITLSQERVSKDITITAEDGSTEIYTLNINRTIPRDLYLENISLSGLSGINCTNLCGLNPTFKADVFDYTVTVPYAYDTLKLAVEKMNDKQTVKYIMNGEEFKTKEIDVGVHNITIEVYDGLNKKTAEYNLMVERQKSDNNYLSDIKIDNVSIEGFDREITEYDIEVPYQSSSLNVAAIKEDSNAQVSISDTNLNVFKNKIEITVTSHLGNERKYILNVFRLPEENNLLKSITVTGQTEYNLIPNFEKSQFSYSVIVDTNDKEVTIGAEADDPTSTVTGTGVKKLKAGFNKVDISVISANGETRFYTLSIIRYAEDNVYLGKLDISNGTMLNSFNKEVTNYVVNVENDVTELDISAEPESEDSSLKIDGNQNLKTGNNTVTLTVSNYDNSNSKIYVLTVIKKGSTDNTLSDIKIDDVSIEGFDREIKSYTVTVPADKLSVNVNAIANNEFATVVGGGVSALQEGNNIVNIIVVSESGTINTYTLTINREYGNYLSDIIVGGQTLNPSFEKTHLTYTVTVPNSVKRIVVAGARESSNQTIIGNGEYDLELGENTFEITVQKPNAQDKTYIVTVNRDASDSNYLTQLSVGEGKISPTFDKETQNYEVTIPNDKTSLSINYIKESESSTVSIVGNEDLISGSTVQVRVTSESGLIRTYKISVTKAKAEEYSNKLSSLSVDEASISPTFDRDTNLYTVNVDSNVSSIYIRATREDTQATIKGTGKVNLTGDYNEFKVVVTSKDGVDRTYTLIVNKISKEARLSKLSFNETTFSPSFNSDTTEYEMSYGTDLTQVTIKEIETVDKKATYEVRGLDLKSDKIMVIVTAPDKTTQKTYTINLTSKLSGSSKLSSIITSTGTLEPTFNRDKYVYTVNVPSTVNSINIDAYAESVNATVTGTGIKELTKATTTVNILVTAENGVFSNYTLIINKDLDSNNKLKDLYVRGKQISPNFDKDTTSYTLEVESDVSGITIDGVKGNDKQTVIGFGEKTLKTGLNEFSVVTIAEDGSFTSYIINVTKKKLVSSKLTSLSIAEGTLSPSFSKTTTEYSATIPNEYDRVTISYQKDDEDAEVKISNNSEFVEGENKVVNVEVTATDGSTTTYKLNITRAAQTNNFLKSLSVDGQTIEPTFDKNTLNYTLTVGNDVESININAEADDSNATVTGIGEKSVNLGENNFDIKVADKNGVARIYKLKVTREYDNNNDLSDLIVEGYELSPKYNKNTKVYTLDVAENVDKVTIIASTDSDKATVVGDGEKSLTKGENTFDVTVTSQGGLTNTYTVKITRLKDSNTDLKNITSSVSKIVPDFDNSFNSYDISLDSSVNILSLDVEPVKNTTTVTGNENLMITEDEMSFDITITAEDGTSRVITINTYKSSNITDITLLKNEITMFTGEIYQVEPIILPESAKDNKIVYNANNDNVIVTEEGLITASKVGESRITISSFANENVSTELIINVKADKLSSNVYDVKDIEEDQRIIIGAEEKTTIEEFISNLDNDRENLIVYDNDVVVEDYNTTIRTGLIIKLVNNGSELDSVYIVLRGDTNEDGIINIADQTRTLNVVLKKSTFEPYLLYAADVDIQEDIPYDERIKIADSTKILNYVLKKLETLN